MHNNINYISNLVYENTPFINDNVMVDITITKEPAYIVITNELTNEKEEVVPTASGDEWVYQREESANGKYTFYVEYKDHTISDIYHYNVRIDKVTPSFTIQAGGTFKIPENEEYSTISSKDEEGNIEETNINDTVENFVEDFKL